VPNVLEALGVETMTAYTDADAGWFERLYDKALSLYPVGADERCQSAASSWRIR